MIINKYYNKELVHTIIVILLVAIVIVACNMFVRYLTIVSGGNIESRAVIQFIMLMMPKYITYLTPISVFFSILLVYGKNFANNEIFVTLAGGVTWMQLVKNTIKPIFFLFIVELFLTMYAMPMVERNYDLVKQTAVKSAVTSFISPGEIISFNGNKNTIYVGSKDSNGNLYNVFLSQKNKNHLIILTSPKGYIENSKDNEKYIVLSKGYYYNIDENLKSTEYGEFSKAKRFIDTKINFHDRNSLKDYYPSELFKLVSNGNRLAIIELIWRLAFPIGTVVGALLGLAMCRLRPRQNRYAKFVPAIIVFIIYFNLISVSKNLMIHNTIPWWIGGWLIHAIFGLSALYILNKQNGTSIKNFFKRGK